MSRDIGVEDVTRRLADFADTLKSYDVDVFDIVAMKTLLLLSPGSIIYHLLLRGRIYYIDFTISQRSDLQSLKPTKQIICFSFLSRMRVMDHNERIRHDAQLLVPVFVTFGYLT